MSFPEFAPSRPDPVFVRSKELFDRDTSGFHPYRNGARSATAGVVRITAGRNPAIAQQRTLMLAAQVSKVEKEKRAMAVRGRGRRFVFGPPTDDPMDFSVRTGELGLCILNEGSTFRQCVTADNNVRVVTSANGLPRNANLGMPCVTHSDNDVSKAHRDDRTGVAVGGVETIAHTGQEPVQCGDKLYVDPNPYMVLDEMGKEVPGIQGPAGIPDTKQRFQARPMRTQTLDTLLQSFEADVHRHFQSKDFREHLAAANTEQALVAEITRICKAIFDDDKHVSDDMPIRGYLPVYATWTLRKLLSIPSFLKAGAVTPAVRMRYEWLAMRALVQVLKNAEQRFSHTVQQFNAMLPHVMGPDADALQHARHVDYSVHSKHLADLLDIDAKTPSPRDRLAEASARLDMFYSKYKERLIHMQRAWQERFFLGTALSSANKAGQLDVLVGN